MEKLQSNPMGKFFGKVANLTTSQSKVGKPILDVVIEEGEIPNKDTNYVKFEVYNDKISLFSEIKLNDIIEIHYNIKGNNYKGKIYTNLHVNNVVLLDQYKSFNSEDFELPSNEDLIKDFK